MTKKSLEEYRHISHIQVVREPKHLRGGTRIRRGSGGVTLTMWNVVYDSSGNEILKSQKMIGEMPIFPDENFQELSETGKRFCILYGEGTHLDIVDMITGKEEHFYNRSGSLEFA